MTYYALQMTHAMNVPNREQQWQREEVKLLLESMTPGGEALARHQGLIFFVPFGVPGERVRARITLRKKSFARAEIVEILGAAPHRVEPRCRYFGLCGGCEWQHIGYPTQLAYKSAIVEEQFRRIGKFENTVVLPCLPSPLPYGYRNRTRLACSECRRPGYRAANSHHLVEVDDCPVLEPALYRTLQSAARTDLDLREDEWLLRSQSPTIQVSNFTYTVSPDSFFQANTAIAARLVDELLARLALTGSERLLDLYCGVGLFTLPLSLRVAHVTGVEANPSATADAHHNLAALRAGFPKMAETQILTANVEDALTRPEITGHPWDVVVDDPPRAGVERAALQRIIDLHPQQIGYVSCDPATLARDARLLADSGYELGPIQPLDMFPQTHHVESVACFRLMNNQ
jgi:23S rRNA (uracil1939-C5)-methyltransferase